MADNATGAEELPRAVARARYVRLTAMKARRVVDLIRGRNATEALAVLQFAPQAASEPVAKVLASAMANAEDRGIRNVGDLVVADARGDGGPMFKRLMPRARGMAYLIRRRSAHIAIGLADPSKLTQPQAQGGNGQSKA